ncbi:hypothetical protein ACTFJW_07380 [Clostridium cagae]|uniref:hypothetical protein n=1 Tax=Clostridium cagae TaxID=2080751 RepID=UPI003F770C6F
MKINKEIYKKIKKEVENDLKNYPYYLISIETPGLGSAIRPDIVINKGLNPSDPVGKSIVDIEYKTALIKIMYYLIQLLLYNQHKLQKVKQYLDLLKSMQWE